MKCWVLTREINEYDQEGAYFEAVFKEKPSIKQLAEHFTGRYGFPNDVMQAVAFLEHLRDGGGRRGVEHEWYNLEEVELK